MYKSKKLIGLLIILFSTNVFALKSDDKQDMLLEANGGTVDLKNKISIVSGGVVITRGSIKVTADKGTAQDRGGYKTINLLGSPVTFEQLQDDGEKIEGQGNQFDYNTSTRLAILSGRARIKKGKNTVAGEKITYNTVTQVYSVSGALANGINSKKINGKVRVILDQAVAPINSDSPKKIKS